MTDTHRQILQRSPSQKWCLLCCDWKPSKGGTTKNGFRCAAHKPKEKK